MRRGPERTIRSRLAPTRATGGNAMYLRLHSNTDVVEDNLEQLRDNIQAQTPP